MGNYLSDIQGMNNPKITYIFAQNGIHRLKTGGAIAKSSLSQIYGILSKNSGRVFEVQDSIRRELNDYAIREGLKPLVFDDTGKVSCKEKQIL